MFILYIFKPRLLEKLMGRAGPIWCRSQGSHVSGRLNHSCLCSPAAHNLLSQECRHSPEEPSAFLA